MKAIALPASYDPYWVAPGKPMVERLRDAMQSALPGCGHLLRKDECGPDYGTSGGFSVAEFNAGQVGGF